MSVSYEFLKKTYPEWYPESRGEILIIFLAVALFLIVPYIYARFIEERLTNLLRNIWHKIYFKYGRILQKIRY